MNPFKYVKYAVGGLLGLVLLLGSFYTVNPGQRGIVVTMGKMPTGFSSEGLNFKLPLISSVEYLDVKQLTQEMSAPAFSSDRQQLNTTLQILYRIPESSVLTIFQKYSGNPFDSLIAPRVQEAFKEVTALENAGDIIKKRESIKMSTLVAARKKIGDILIIEDIVVEDIKFSPELERAIEAKMVQEQEVAKATFTKEKATIDAQTAVITAEGEAQAIRKRGDAIRQNPGVVDLMIAEKWNGVAPLVVGGSGKSANVMLPIKSGQ